MFARANPQEWRSICGWTGASSRPHGRRSDQVVDRLPREGVIPFGDEQPWQPVGAGREVALDGTQFVTSDGLLDRQAALEAAHPKSGVVEVQLVAAQADSLSDAQAVAEHHEQEQMVTCAVPSHLGGVKQRRDLALAEVVLGAFMPVSGAVCARPSSFRRHSRRATLYISPV